MAEPALTGPKMITLVHSTPVGARSSGWTVVSRQLMPSTLVQNSRVVVSDTNGNQFTVEYTAQADGSPGMIRHLVDPQGAKYRWGGSGWFRSDGG